MPAFDNRRLITPPKEEEEIYPYRRVWRSIIVQSVILMTVMGALFVLRNFLGVGVPELVRPLVNMGLALLPAMLWLVFSRLAENFALRPRARLFTVFLISALVANAVGLPLLEDFIQPDSWLSLQDTTTRILGYTATVGIVQEFLKYVILRFVVWPGEYHVRVDSVAYGMASAIGYATVVCVSYVANNPTAFSDVVAIRIFGITSAHIVGSIIMAYGLSATLFNDALSVVLPVMLILASGFVGLTTALRTAFANTALTVGSVSAPRFLFGIAFSVGVYIGLMIAIFFLLEVAERRERARLLAEAT